MTLQPSVLLFASLGLFAGFVGATSSAHAQSCSEVCAAAPSMSSDQWDCMGATATALGYEVLSNAACLSGQSTGMCTACFMSVGMNDGHCAQAYQLCAQGSAVSPDLAQQLLREIGVESAGLGNGVPNVLTGDTGAATCGDNTNCVCAGGQVCATTCSFGGCNITGAGGAVIVAMCSGGNCNMTCAGGGQCTFDCSGGDCNISAAMGAVVTATCSGGGCNCAGVDCQ